MSLALQEGLIRRVWGMGESLSGDQATARAALVSTLGTTSGGHPAFRYGAKANSAVYPEVTFREDQGSDALAGMDIGIVYRPIYRMEIWEQTGSGTLIPQIADYLELLFDCRRGAPALTVDAPGKCWWGEVFTHLQAPFFDTGYKAFFGLIAFQFVEARP